MLARLAGAWQLSALLSRRVPGSPVPEASSSGSGPASARSTAAIEQATGPDRAAGRLWSARQLTRNRVGAGGRYSQEPPKAGAGPASGATPLRRRLAPAGVAIPTGQFNLASAGPMHLAWHGQRRSGKASPSAAPRPLQSCAAYTLKPGRCSDSGTSAPEPAPEAGATLRIAAIQRSACASHAACRCVPARSGQGRSPIHPAARAGRLWDQIRLPSPSPP